MKKFHIAATLLSTLLLTSLTVCAQTEVNQAEPEKKSLAVSEEDRNKYSDFLKSQNTGLIRLFPREKKYVVKAEKRRNTTPATPGSFERKSLSDLSGVVPDAQSAGQAPKGGGGVPTNNENVVTNLADVPRVSDTAYKNSTLNGNGAYYSFAQLTHEYGFGSDLSLEAGLFRVGFAGADYGFLTDLGDVPLETIDLDTPPSNFFATYVRAEKEPDARLEYRRFGKGVEIEGLSVKSSLAVKLHSTYLLRSVNYRESDVLVAFKVVDIDSDGSAIILWKLLKKYSTPQLARN